MKSLSISKNQSEDSFKVLSRMHLVPNALLNQYGPNQGELKDIVLFANFHAFR